MRKISLGAAFSSAFSTPNKWTTILLLSVCFLIPFVGPIVIMGYLMRRFVNERRGQPAADFSFDFFGEYLKIGLWPFLVSLVVSLIAVPLLMVAQLPMFAVSAAPENEGLIITMLIVTVLLFISVMLILMLFTYPMMLRSALTQSFGEGFKLGWTFSFIQKVGGQAILWGLLLSLISIPLVLVGYLALIVGAYVVSAVLTFVSYHLMFQLYDRFIDKGGEPIDVHPDLVGHAPQFTQQMPPPINQ